MTEKDYPEMTPERPPDITPETLPVIAPETLPVMTPPEPEKKIRGRFLKAKERKPKPKKRPESKAGFLGNLKLRTKFIASFVAITLLVGILSYVGIQFAFEQIAEDAIPTMKLVSQVGKLVRGSQAETLEFISTGEEESIAQFNETITELNVIVGQLNEFGDDPGEAEIFANLGELIQGVNAKEQEIIQSHTQTLASLEDLEELEVEAGTIFAGVKGVIAEEIERNFQGTSLDKLLAGEFPSQQAIDDYTEFLDELQQDSFPSLQAISDFIEGTRLLQSEALEFVATGEEDILVQVEEAEEQLEAAQVILAETLEADEPREAGLLEQLDGIEEQIEAKSRGIITSHGNTLELLEELEILEEDVLVAISAVQQVADQDALEGLEQANRNSLISSGVSMLAALFFGVLIANATVRPVAILVEATERMGAGDFKARAEVHSSDEIGQLATNFNQMAAELQTTFEGLEERSREMEASQRVTFAASKRTTPEDFLNLLVNLITDQFDVYHAQIYLVDEDRKNAVLEQSTGYAGRELLQRAHLIPLDQEALVTRCINSGEPVLVGDVSEIPTWLPNPLLPYTQSELVVPLIVDDEVIGALDIQDRVAGRFTEQAVPVFSTMIEHVATLFQTTELLDEIERRTGQIERTAEQLRASAEVANQISAILDPDQLLTQAMVLMQSNFKLYHVHVYIYNEDSQDLILEAGSGQVGILLKEQKHSISIDSETSVVARAARNQDPVLVADASEEAEFMANPLLPNTQSELAIPLVAGGKLLGVLDMQDEQANRFTEADADAFSTLAGQLATSLQTARLFAEQRKIQDALASSEAQFRTLVDYAPEAIVVFDVDTGKYVDVNDNATKLYGMSREDLLKIRPTDVSPEYQPNGKLSAEVIPQQIQRAIKGEHPIFDWVHIKANGEEVPCEIRLVKLPDTDRNLVRASITDITERKQAEETIIQGDRLKSEFLANMSHELRTPLNSIIGYTDVLMLGIDGELNDEVMKDLDAINENSQTLLKIIDDILDLAKIEVGRMNLEISSIDVKSLYDDLVKNNAGLLVNKPVEFMLEVEENLPAIKADHVRVVQMLNNLIFNAIKFTTAGQITLRAGQDNHDFVRLEVEDTGMGINKEDLEKIFDEFQQADNSSTRTVEGTGLGLTITRRLVQLHGGSIHVESEVGKGSTFTIRLPLEPKVPTGTLVTYLSETAQEEVSGNENNRKKEPTGPLSQ